MKGIYITAIVIVACFTSSQAQKCVYANLSYKFNFELIVKRTLDTNVNYQRISAITLKILNKKDRLLQKINISSGYLFETAFKSDSSSRSYVTGKNRTMEVSDYDFGDLIIADLNFDGKEDIAIKFDSGGNGGPNYAFYMQDTAGHFIRDNFLTDTVRSFPRYINLKRKTITTQIHANVDQEGQKTFKYNSNRKRWRLIKWIMVEA